MQRFSFRKGLIFCEGQRHWTLLRRLATGQFQMEDQEGQLQNVDQATVHMRWHKGEWAIDEESLGGSNVFYLATPRDLSTFQQKYQETARYRYEYVSRLACDEECISMNHIKTRVLQIAEELKDSAPPSASSVNRWWRRYKRAKCITALIDLRHSSGRRRTGGLAYQYFEEALNEIYLTDQKHRGLEVYEALVIKVARFNATKPENEKICCPSRATIYRWLLELHQDIVDRERLGKQAADIKYRRVRGTLKVKKILDRVEIDHTPLDVIVIDQKTNLPLGRPWLTLAVDVYSRAIVGFYIGFHAPSSYSVMQCLKRCILPKDDLLQRFPDIKNQWLAHGIPVEVVCDNGADLHSEAFREICREMGILLMFCPAKEPWWKGTIERLMRTINHGLIHKIPGTVFSSVDERGDYSSEKLAAVTIETLTHLITKWVVDVYHQTPHRKLIVTPAQKWQEGLSRKIIELPAFPEQLDILVGIPETRTLFHYGIEYDKNFYNSDQLQALRLRSGKNDKVQFKSYDEDVGYVHVYDPYNCVYFRVEAIDQEYAAGLPRHVHAMIRAALLRDLGNDYNQLQLLEAKEEIQKIIEKATRSKRMADRKKVAAYSGKNSESVFARESSALNTSLRPGKQQLLQPPEMLAPGLDDDLPEFPTFELEEQN